MFIDFLSFTTKRFAHYGEGYLTSSEIILEARCYFQSFFEDLPTDLMVIKNKSGLFGYTHSFSVDLKYLDGTPTCKLGTFAFGGNNSSFYFQITGSGCKYLDIQNVYNFIKLYNCKITRVDIATDLNLSGKQYDFTYFTDAYKNGLFKHSKSPINPKHLIIGDFLDEFSPRGRTLYVGSRKGQKFARIYEKGKEQGVLNTDWIRFEIEFKSVDHSVICPDCLLNLSSIFVDAFPVCALLVVADPKSYRKYSDRLISMAVVHRSIDNIKKQYGPALSFLSKYCDVSLVDLVRSGNLPEQFSDVYATIQSRRLLNNILEDDLDFS